MRHDHIMTEPAKADEPSGRSDRRRRQQILAIVTGAVAIVIVIAIGITRSGNEDTAGTMSPRTTKAPIILSQPTSTPMPGGLVGLTLDGARTEAAAAGWTVRVVSQDGEDFMVTLDYVEKRANLTVVDGVVTKATEG
jgi:hypothetical protein